MGVNYFKDVLPLGGPFGGRPGGRVEGNYSHPFEGDNSFAMRLVDPVAAILGPTIPDRLDCFDSSTWQGTDPSAPFVGVWPNPLPGAYLITLAIQKPSRKIVP